VRFAALALAALAAVQPFRNAEPGRRFAFPRDHGAHRDFSTEWWYFTGLLRDAGGRTYGYQLTFFRRGLGPPGGGPHWGTGEIHLAHAALTDVAGSRFTFDERLGRPGFPAGAGEGGLDLRNGGWSARMDGTRTIRLAFTVREATLDLEMEAPPEPVVFGEDGMVRKGDDPGAASHYLTFPRLATKGTLDGKALRGTSWMDHEFSSAQLSRGQRGWDWAGIRLRDGRSLMAYRMRRDDGSQDPWSLLTEIDASGRVSRSTRSFSLRGGSWRSPASGADYPLPLRLESSFGAWTLEPLVRDQELRTRAGTRITYWEGACRVLDPGGAEAGEAYVELTGYAHPMAGRF